MNIRKKPTIARRLPLRGWASLDDLRRSIQNKAEEGNWSAVPELIHQTNELCGASDREAFWLDVVEVYNKILQANLPTKDFPILQAKEKGKPLPWEYSGRSWYFWLHLFASSYGWSTGQIGNLDIDTAIALFQEIETDSQLEKEWQWGLSEVSYSYDKATKRSRFNSLPRPSWMRPAVGAPKPVKTERMPANAVPMGVVINLDGN